MKNRYKKDRTLKFILEHFVRIPGTDLMISIIPLWGGYTWEGAHFMLNKFNLFMPSPAIFMPYARRVIAGWGRLHNGLGKYLSESESKKLKHILTGDCHTWLNIKFVKGYGYKNIDLETVMGVDPISRKFLTKKEPLKNCNIDDDDIWSVQSSDYLFNKQGLPAFNFSTFIQASLRLLPIDNELEYIPPYNHDLHNEGNVATFAAWFNYGEKEFFNRLDCASDPVKEYNEVFGCIKRNELPSDVKYLASYIQGKFY